jgi:hypothetical protein
LSDYPIGKPNTASYEKGTLPGTVPKTGKTTVHEGEVIIPKPQVTPSLLAMLTEDARRKGTLAKGYKCGSLGKGYQPGSLDADSLLAYQEMIAQGRAAPGAHPDVPAVRGIGGPGRMRGEEELYDAWMQLKERMNPEMRKMLEAGEKRIYGQEFLGPGRTIVTPPPAQYGQAAGPATMPKLIGAGKTAGAGGTLREVAAEVAPKVAKMRGGGKYGRALALIGAGSVPLSVAMAGLNEQVPELTMPAEETGEPPGALEGFGRSLGHGAGQLADLINMIRGGAGKMTAGIEAGVTGQTPEQVMLERNRQMGERLRAGQAQPTEEELGVTEPPPLSEGPREAPARESREELYQKLRGMPEQIQSQHKAKMSEIEAERLLDVLRFNRNIDPQVAKSILDKVAFNMKISDKYTKLAAGREKAVQEEIKSGANFDRQMQLWAERERLTGERQMDVKTLEAMLKQRVESSKQRGRLMSDLQLQHSKEKSSRVRNQIMEKIASEIVRHSLANESVETVDMQTAREIASQFLVMNSEDTLNFLSFIEGGTQ